MVEYYRSEKINEKMTAIRSMTGEIMYLVEGKEKAVLVDTCLGVGHLRKFVENLTDKPITVLLTHGHVDHALGAPEFDEVYMNSADIEVYEKMSPLEERIEYIQANLGGNLPAFTEDDYVKPSPADFKELTDGQSFDLGGVHIEVYALPGHTHGTMVMLIPEERALILGDACNNSTFLFDENSLSVNEYKENLIKVKEKLEGRYDTTYLCHHVMTASKDMIAHVIEVCDDILDGKADDIPFEFMGHHAFVAKKANERFERVDGGEGNIVYDKEKLK
ncbi:MBL fold metallo-hydrolase [Firmicutes bacterium AM43-11BH]|nr:MBL fold metallo-hydrolase [Firmicutes bacterium AM43-11BH]